MSKIVTLGEIMLRLSPKGNYRFVQSDSFQVIPGGGEANVAVSLANYGHASYFVSKLPAHEIGQIAVNGLRRYGVNTDYIVRGGDRVGLYYAETGASMRPSKVPLQRQILQISTLMKSWRVQIGSIGVASLLQSVIRLQSLPDWLVKQPNAIM